MASGGRDAGGSRSLRVECYIRGYHVYQRIWNPVVGEVAIAVREEDNVHDRYAVAIRIGSGPSTRSKKVVIFAAIAS